MPPKPRDSQAGLHHIWVSATGGEAYFVDEIDRIEWLRLFVRTAARYDWTRVAFTQMTTHVHGILEIRDESLPAGMKALNLAYSRAFNERHGRKGQLLRRRYGSRRIESGTDLLGVYVYTVLNPVEAGLCRRAEDWHWSSHATTIGLRRDFPFIDGSLVLAELGGSQTALRDLVASEALRRRLSLAAMSGV